MQATPPPQLMLSATSLAVIAAESGLELLGPDREIRTLNYIAGPAQYADVQLTYASTTTFAADFARRGIAACVVPRTLANAVPAGSSLLVTDDDPIDAFYGIFTSLVGAGRWQTLPESRGDGVRIARSAVVHDGVHLGDGCRIMDNAVILPNTWLGDGVVVKPNAVIGGDGFEVKTIGGRRRVVPHAGGVWLGDDVEVGSNTCIDRGLFGEFTAVGPGSKVDNLVHIAHRATIGAGCSIIACAEVSGSVVLGDNVWIGPNASINQGLTLGDHSFVGTGSVVTRPVPAHALVYGSPAKAGGWLCSCRTALKVADGVAACGACGRTYQVDSAGGVMPSPR